jgi:hypothetical protein
MKKHYFLHTVFLHKEIQELCLENNWDCIKNKKFSLGQEQNIR